mmetsp:Transcript_36733/g.105861  ORF Transcript_36733/g.105861 Transcript_36733/m.105861 type:complete len:270 (+) Transcript_36733:886-1695(+)
MKDTQLVSKSSFAFVVCGRAADALSEVDRNSNTKSLGRNRCRTASLEEPWASSSCTSVSSFFPSSAASNFLAFSAALSPACSAKSTGWGHLGPPSSFFSASVSPFRRCWSLSSFSSRMRFGFSAFCPPLGNSPFAAAASKATPHPPASAQTLLGLMRGQCSHARLPRPAEAKTAPTLPKPPRWTCESLRTVLPGSSALRASCGETCGRKGGTSASSAVAPSFVSSFFSSPAVVPLLQLRPAPHAVSGQQRMARGLTANVPAVRRARSAR